MEDATTPRPVPTAAEAPASNKLGGLYRERVLEITHYTDRLFSFKTTRSPAFRFQSGQFAMIGLQIEGKPLLRAYSMTSAVYEDWLEFFSIKVPDGPLTSTLQHIKVGDELLVGQKPTGTLITGNLKPGKRLFLFATGTGFAPFASILRDPEIYDQFETIVAAEGCRLVAELQFATQVVVGVRSHELLGELVADKLQYYATVTREPYHHMGHIPDLIANGKLCADLQIEPFSRETDRAMICGSPAMLTDLTKLLNSLGLEEGSSGKPGDYVIEKAFVER